jgi:hypothetical protein
MGKQEHTTYTCDRCGKKLPTFANKVAIVTKLNPPEDKWWRRIILEFSYHHGFNNGGEQSSADLCKPCTLWLLRDSIKRITAGERITKGYQSIEQKGWNEI